MTSGTYQGQQPDRQQIIKDMMLGAGGVAGVVLLLVLVVVVGINYIPYFLAASWLINRVPGLAWFLKGASTVAFPMAVAGLAFATFHFARAAVAVVSDRRLKHVPVILAFAVVVICVVSNADVISIFVALIGSAVGTMVTLAQFRWILAQRSESLIRESRKQEERTSDLQDPDFSPAARSARMALKHGANVAMIIDCLVSLFVYPPIAINMLMVLAATQNLGLVDWGNVAMVLITTVVPGIIYKLWLDQTMTAADLTGQKQKDQPKQNNGNQQQQQNQGNQQKQNNQNNNNQQQRQNNQNNGNQWQGNQNNGSRQQQNQNQGQWQQGGNQ